MVKNICPRLRDLATAPLCRQGKSRNLGQAFLANSVILNSLLTFAMLAKFLNIPVKYHRLSTRGRRAKNHIGARSLMPDAAHCSSDVRRGVRRRPNTLGARNYLRGAIKSAQSGNCPFAPIASRRFCQRGRMLVNSADYHTYFVDQISL